MNAGAVLVAAGLGTRLGAGKPKALVTLGGEPLVTHAVRNLLAAGGVSRLVVVTPASHESDFDEALAGFDAGIVSRVGGGAERSDSVRCGLRALDRACDVVLVHDAARCLAPPTLVSRVLEAVEAGADAVIPGVAVVDTVKVVEAYEPRDGVDVAAALDAPIDAVVSTPPRASLRAVQTPQGFRRSALVAAHESGLDATDDAALVERTGGQVVVVEGDELALKVTTQLDLVVAEHLLARSAAGAPIRPTHEE